MKYSKRQSDSLQNRLMDLIRALRPFKSQALNPNVALGSHVFMDKNTQLMYDTLFSKAKSRGDEIKRRRILNMSHAERWKMGWKSFWRKKKASINWSKGNWTKFYKPDQYYRWRKYQFKNRFYKRPIVVGYTTLGYSKFPLYKEYPYL